METRPYDYIIVVYFVGEGLCALPQCKILIIIREVVFKEDILLAL